MIKVAVLFGGQSSEHSVSLMSAASVLENFPQGYEKYLVGITTDGRWYHFKGEVSELADDKWQDNPDNEEVILSPSANHHGFYQLKSGSVEYVDVIYPILHGRYAEDGTLSGVCQLAGIPIVACNLTSSALTMDKEYTHVIAGSNGIKMAKYIVLRREEQYDYDALFAKVQQELGLPCYVKPTCEGSSYGAHKINDRQHFEEYIQDAFSYDRKILLEEFIDGYEVGAGIMGKDDVGEVFEIIVHSEMYGFEEKYEGYATEINTPALSLNQQQVEEIKETSLKIYQMFDCDLLSRVDFFMSKTKGLVFLEVNSLPGFTSHSLFPASFKAKGLTYSQIIDRLIKLALKER